METVLAASAADVYRAWTEPAALRGWLCEDAHGRCDRGEQLVLAWPSLGQRVALDVLEAIPGQHLHVAANIGGARQQQRVHLEARGDSCALELHQDADDDFAEGVEHGWRLRLYLLEHYLRHRAPRRTLTVASTSIGAPTAIFERLVSAVETCALPAPAVIYAPDAAGGQLDDDTVYTLRRFTMATGSHLAAIQLMTWNADLDLERHRPMIDAVLRAALDPVPPTVH